MSFIGNLDLLAVGISIAAIGVLGCVVYLQDRRSATNRAVGYFAAAAIAWSMFNYAYYQAFNSDAVLFLLRAHAFFAVWYTFFLFRLFYVFPATQQPDAFWLRFFLTPATALVALISLTPAVFRSVTAFTPAGRIETVSQGPGIALFAGLILGLVVGGFTIIYRKYRHAADTLEKRNAGLVVSGAIVTFALHIVFNLALPAVFGDTRFVPLGGVFIFPFIFFASYAILKNRLFNVKVAGTAILVFALAIATFGEIALASDVLTMLYRIVVLALVLTFGGLLIKGVMREVEQREMIEKQEKLLEVANSQQQTLLHFISHEIKGYLAKGEAAFAEIAEDREDNVPKPTRKLAAAALDEMRKGVATVMNILEAANFKQGTVSFKKKPLDFRALVWKVIEEQRPAAYEKHLGLDVNVADGAYVMSGDEEKIREHVIRNLVDNAIRYTPAGTVHIALSDGDGKIHFSVEDSGVGITPEDMEKLFTEGGHGKDSIRVNVHSTGYGLFIAKQVVDGHGGRIWAESEGEGKGARFVVEFTV